MAITKRQFEAANKRGEAAIARGPVARSARYDARRALIVVSLEGGCEFAFPVSLVEALSDAPRARLSRITVSPNGLALHWPLASQSLEGLRDVHPIRRRRERHGPHL